MRINEGVAEVEEKFGSGPLHKYSSMSVLVSFEFREADKVTVSPKHTGPSFAADTSGNGFTTTEVTKLFTQPLLSVMVTV